MNEYHDPLLGEKIKMIHRFGSGAKAMKRLAVMAPAEMKYRIQRACDAYNEFCRRYPLLTVEFISFTNRDSSPRLFFC